MSTPRGIGLVLAALLLVAAGCGKQDGVDPGGTPDRMGNLDGRTFLSTAVTAGGEPRPMVAGTRVSLWFAEDGRLVANAGCNTIMADDPELTDGRLRVTGLGMTEMGCDADLHAQDEWLVEFLERAPQVSVEDDRLVLTSADTVLELLDREVAEPDLPLADTQWTLDTLYAGDTAANTAGMEQAYLIFSEGQVSGSSGCNTFGGPVTFTESVIEFGDLIWTLKACSGDAGKIEKAMQDVLAGNVAYTVDAGTLVLNPDGEVGLGLHGDQG